MKLEWLFWKLLAWQVLSWEVLVVVLVFLLLVDMVLTLAPFPVDVVQVPFFSVLRLLHFWQVLS